MRKLNAYTVYLILVGSTAFFFGLFGTMSHVYRVEVGLTPMQLVLVGTMLELSIFIFEVPTGIVADIYSRRLSVIIGYALIGLGFMLEGSYRLVGTIWLAQWVWGIGYTFTSGAEQAWLAGEIGEERLTNAFLRAAQVGQIAGILGVIVSSVLAMLNLGLTLVVAGVGFVATAVFLLLFMPETGFAPIPKGERTTWSHMAEIFREGGRIVRASPILLTLFAVSLTLGLSSEGLDRYWAAHFIENFTFPDLWQLDYVVWFGIMSVGTSLLTLGATEYVRRRVDAEDDETAVRALMVINFTVFAAVIIFAWAGNFALALAAYWVTFVFRATTGPIFNAFINRQIAPQVRATVLSMHGQMDAIGQIISGPLMGVVATLGNYRVALSAVGLLWLMVVPLYGRALALLHRRLRALA